MNPTDVSISIPATAPDNVDSVIVLNCAGDIQTDTNRLLQPEFPLDTLRAFDADLHGKGLKFGPGKKTDDMVINWTKTDEYISWPVRLEKAATYDVAVNYTAGPESDGGTFTVKFGDQALNGTVKSGTDRTLSVGRVVLSPGNFAIRLQADSINGGELWRVRRLELKPVPSQMK